MVVLSPEDRMKKGLTTDEHGSGKIQIRVTPRNPWLKSLALLVFAFFASGCDTHQNNAVVVYTSQDQVYAEPILKRFTARTGIPVAAVYDSESVKTAGLVNRLKAESAHPQCDVFWNNEELLTRHLAR